MYIHCLFEKAGKTEKYKTGSALEAEHFDYRTVSLAEQMLK